MVHLTDQTRLQSYGCYGTQLKCQIAALSKAVSLNLTQN